MLLPLLPIAPNCSPCLRSGVALNALCNPAFPDVGQRAYGGPKVLLAHKHLYAPQGCVWLL